MSDKFGDTAVKLSSGPLGILALFIVLIEAILAFVLALASDLSETQRSILITFIVFFPVAVLGVFTWLVAFHHTKLYPPQAFKDQTLFKSLALFGRTEFDKQARPTDRPKNSAAPLGTLNSAVTGSLYWLGHDLMWTADALLRQAPSQSVLVGLDQAKHHLVQVGLGDTQIAREIDYIWERVEKSEDLSPTIRDAYASQLGSIIDRIGITAETAQQHHFETPPHWNRVRA